MDLVPALFASGLLKLSEPNPPSPTAAVAEAPVPPVLTESQPSSSTTTSGSASVDKPLSRTPTPPSLLWKAYAQALRPWLSLNADLSTVSQALFVASPLQPGIPASNQVPIGVTNYQEYIKSDCMQTKDVPIYSLENGSYFNQLWAYLRNVQIGEINDKLEETRSELDHAKSVKDEAFNKTLHQYQDLESHGQTSFIDWIKQHSNDYSKAWTAEDKLEKEYENLQDPAMDDILRALATMKSADSRADFKDQSNMPCIVTDKNYYIISGSNSSQPPAIDPNQAYYRPYHMLSGYGATAQTWLSNYDPDNYSKNRTTIPFDFDTARDVSWASLGHEELDQGHVPNSADDLYSSVSATFSYVGMQAFDIDRGLWDVKKPRNMQLGPRAPDYLRKPFYKTTRLLLGYGVDLTITLPVAVNANDILKQNKIISLLGIPVTRNDIQQNVLHVASRDNAYPVLLAVLAQQV